MDVLGRIETNPLEVRGQLVLAVVVPLFAPFDSWVIHLVDQDHQVLHTSSFHKHSVLARLSTSLKASLELPLTRADDEDGKVGLAGASDHVGHVGLVAGRIENREMLLLCLEVGAPHLYRLSLVPLLLVGIHAPRQVPSLSVFILRLFLVLFQRPLVHHVGQIHELATDGGLPSVHVADENNVDMFLLCGHALGLFDWLVFNTGSFLNS